jgi:cytoskeletal protein CcmA (bactofilin family)
MFKKSTAFNTNSMDTLVGEGTKIEGNLFSKGGIRIEGQVRGDISTTGDVTIGEQAVIHSNITARNVINAGTIHGGITCQESLKITASGRIYGSLHVKALEIIEGGVFQGTSKMETRTSSTSTAEKPKTEQLTSDEKEKMHLVKQSV